MSKLAPKRVELTARDQEILDVLTHKVRLLTTSQIAHRWWPGVSGAVTNATRRMKRLESVGLVAVEGVLARPELELMGPVYFWSPGDAEPDFVAIARKLRDRWREPVTPTRVVLATSNAAKSYGGAVGGYRPRATEWTHDVHVGAVYLWHEKNRHELASQWIHEQQLRAERCSLFGEHVPDAILRKSPQASPSLVLDFGGSYGKGKLMGFHQCAKSYCYELW